MVDKQALGRTVRCVNCGREWVYDGSLATRICLSCGCGIFQASVSTTPTVVTAIEYEEEAYNDEGGMDDTGTQ